MEYAGKPAGAQGTAQQRLAVSPVDDKRFVMRRTVKKKPRIPSRVVLAVIGLAYSIVQL